MKKLEEKIEELKNEIKRLKETIQTMIWLLDCKDKENSYSAYIDWTDYGRNTIEEISKRQTK